MIRVVETICSFAIDLHNNYKIGVYKCKYLKADFKVHVSENDEKLK